MAEDLWGDPTGSAIKLYHISGHKMWKAGDDDDGIEK